MRFTYILSTALASAWQIIIDPEVLKPVVSTETTATLTETVNILQAPETSTTAYVSSWSSKSKDCQTTEEPVVILSAPTETTKTTTLYTTLYTTPYTTDTTTTSITTEEPVVILSAPTTTETTTYTTPYIVIYTAATETTETTTTSIDTTTTTTTTEELVVILSAPTTTETTTYTTTYTTPYIVIYTTDTTTTSIDTTTTSTTTEEPVVILSAPTTTETTTYTTPYTVLYTVLFTTTSATTTEESVVILSAPTTSYAKDIDPEMYYTPSKKVKTLAATSISGCPENVAKTVIITTTTTSVVCSQTTDASSTTTDAFTCPEAITVTVSATVSTESATVSTPTETATQINFCDNFPDLQLSNGTQNRQGSCNLSILGAIPSIEKLVSTLVLEPVDGTIFLIGEDVIIRIKSLNMDFGNFDDPNSEYYTGPQSLSAEGVILGHTHVTVEKIVDADVFPNPASPVFFRGFDAEPENGELSTTILGSLLVESGPGTYRLCTITTSQSHRPVLMPIARRGAVDDCIRFTIL